MDIMRKLDDIVKEESKIRDVTNFNLTKEKSLITE